MNRNIPLLTAIMLTFALMITLFGNFFSEPILTFAEGSCKEIYLTFDDGPSDRVTPKILDILKEEDVKATFFVIGSQAKTRKNILKREFDEGHCIGVHSYSHSYNEIYSSADALLKDIKKCNDVIASITGKPSGIYRFPGGSFTVAPELKEAVSATGIEYVDWNASFRDSEIKGATANDLYEAAVTTIANSRRIVMLAHDATDKLATVEALREVIRHFKQDGYVFKTF